MKKLLYSLLFIGVLLGTSFLSFRYGKFNTEFHARKSAKEELRGFRALNLVMTDGVESWRRDIVLPKGTFVITPLDKLRKDDIYLAIKPVYSENTFVILKGNGLIEDHDGMLPRSASEGNREK